MTESGDRGWFKKAVVTAGLGVVATIIGAVVLQVVDLDGTDTPERPPASQSAEPVRHEVVKTGRLELKDGLGWNLDVEPGAKAWDQSNWNAGTDLGYTSWDKEIDEDGILTPDNKVHAASLPTGAQGTREECEAAKYGNFAVGKAILPGRLVCIETTEGHLALLRVVAKDPRAGHYSVTVEATVWE